MNAKRLIPFRELPLSNDFIFGHIMRNKNICRMFLEALLKMKIARVEIISNQYDIADSYFSHGIRLDVYLEDDAGTIYCVEMQTSIQKNLYRRVRYYQSALDRHHLQKGMDYINLPESYIIFICTQDPFHYGLPVYKRRMILENCENAEYDDGSHAYFLNSAYKVENSESEDPAIMEFLRCIRENDTRKNHYDTPLMRKVCDAMDEIRDDPVMEANYMQWQVKLMDRERDGFERGHERGREEGIQATIKVLQRFAIDKTDAIRALEEQFALDTETAKEKVAQYWMSD